MGENDSATSSNSSVDNHYSEQNIDYLLKLTKRINESGEADLGQEDQNDKNINQNSSLASSEQLSDVKSFLHPIQT